MNIRRLPPTPCISDKKFSKWLSKQGIAQMKYFLTKTVVLSSTLIEDHRYQSSCTRQCPTGVGHRSRRNGSRQNCKQFNRNHRTLGWQSPGRKETRRKCEIQEIHKIQTPNATDNTVYLGYRRGATGRWWPNTWPSPLFSSIK